MHNTDTNAEKHLIVNLLVMSNVDCCSNTSQPWRPALCGWMRGGWVAPLPGYQAAVGIIWHRTPIRYWYVQPCANCVRVSGRHRYQSQYRCTHTKRQANTPTHIHTHTHTHLEEPIHTLTYSINTLLLDTHTVLMELNIAAFLLCFIWTAFIILNYLSMYVDVLSADSWDY